MPYAIETLLPGIVFAYILGSIPFGLVLSKLFGYGDIRKIGSGNIGATNVLRTGNKALALATLLLDGGKGAAAVLLYIYGFEHLYSLISLPSITEAATDAPAVIVGADALTDSWHVKLSLVGFAAILGHCFPIWLKFKGGKGVATTLGTLLAAVPLAGLAACLTWAVVAAALRYSSLAALLAMVAAPIATFFFYGSMPATIIAAISVMVWHRHQENIKRLIARTEPKIGSKKKGQE
jgi:glycerol-3-phosphate acyltransferase PlsY